MDNITHSLIGITIAETTCALRSPQNDTKKLRPMLYFVSLLANNFPDLDFLYSGITGGKLGYLLHHRGHTHTILGMVPQALLILLLVYGVTKFRKLHWTKQNWKLFSSLTAIGLLLHVFLDSWNIYGVHPFWPINSNWFYGDMIFIIEPWIWFIFIPPLFFIADRKSSKIVYLFLYGFILTLAWVTSYVPTLIAAILTIGGLIYFYYQKTLPTKKRFPVTWVAFSIVLFGFFCTSSLVKTSIEEVLNKNFGAKPLSHKTSDIMTSPMPANPFCWFFIARGVESNNSTYVLRNGFYAILPSILNVNQCPTYMSNLSKNFSLVNSKNTDQVKWIGKFKISLNTLHQFRKQNCEFDAFLLFARAPFWEHLDGELYAADLRFYRRGGRNFAMMPINPGSENCPKYLPGWIPPINDVLRN